MFQGLDGFYAKLTKRLLSTDTYVNLRPEEIRILQTKLRDNYTYLTLRECGKYEVLRIKGNDITNETASTWQLKVERDVLGTGAYNFLCGNILHYHLNTLCVQELINNALVNYTLKTYTDALEARVSALEKRN